MLSDTLILRCLAFLGPDDLYLRTRRYRSVACAPATSKHMRQLTQHEYIWRLDCDDATDKSGVAITLLKDGLLKEALYYGIAPPSGAATAAADEGQAGPGASWYGFYVATKRERERRKVAQEIFREEDDHDKHVVQRWYRAPEFLLSSMHIDTEADMWAMGCILGGMLLREPLLRGSDAIDQVRLATRLVGKPQEDELWHVTNAHARKFLLDLPESTGFDPEVKFGKYLDRGGHRAAIDLVWQLLAFDPTKRIRGTAALGHPWLAESREEPFEEKRGECEAAPRLKVAYEDINSAKLTQPGFQAMLFSETHAFLMEGAPFN